MTASTDDQLPARRRGAADPVPAARADAPEASAMSTLWRTLRVPAWILTTTLFELKVFGVQHVPRTGGAILAANHQSYLDPVLLSVRLPRPVTFLAKSELFGNALFRWLIRSLHAFPVKQGAGDVGAMKESIRRLQEGYLLNIYPEGTRTETGELGPILPGVALVVRRAGVPVVPAAIDGAFDCWPPHRKLPRPGRVSVMYGPAIDFAGAKSDEITTRLDATLRAMIAELRRRRHELENQTACPTPRRPYDH